MLPSKARDADKSTCCPDSSLLPRPVSLKVESWPAWFRIQATGLCNLKALGMVAYPNFQGDILKMFHIKEQRNLSQNL